MPVPPAAARWRQVFATARVVVVVDHARVASAELDLVRQRIRAAGGRLAIAHVAHLRGTAPQLAGLDALAHGPTAIAWWDVPGTGALACLRQLAEGARSPRPAPTARAIYIDGAPLDLADLRAVHELAIAPTWLGDPSGPDTCFATAAELAALRAALRPLLTGRPAVRDDAQAGWRVARIDTAAVMATVPRLRLRDGWQLRGYAYREPSGGHGVVWAVPADARLVDDARATSDAAFRAPRPAHAVPVSDVLHGDGSARAVLDAAVLLRELAEFAAEWHGVSWGAHAIVDAIPEGSWTWRVGLTAQPTADRARVGRVPLGPPADLRPRVDQLADGSRRVRFYSHSGLGQEALYLHVDHVPPDAVAPTACEYLTCATAPGGYVP